MNLETRKIEFVQEFLKLQDEKAIELFEELLKKEKEQLLNEKLNPMRSKRPNMEIESSLDDSENDRVTRARDLKQNR